MNIIHLQNILIGGVVQDTHTKAYFNTSDLILVLHLQLYIANTESTKFTHDWHTWIVLQKELFLCVLGSFAQVFSPKCKLCAPCVTRTQTGNALSNFLYQIIMIARRQLPELAHSATEQNPEILRGVRSLTSERKLAKLICDCMWLSLCELVSKVTSAWHNTASLEKMTWI